MKTLLTLLFALGSVGLVNAQTVVAYDHVGHELATDRFIWLSRGRSGVPIRILEAVGLTVHYDERTRDVRIWRRGTDLNIRIEPLTHVAYTRLPGEEEESAVVYPYPIARNVGGRIYVAARPMEDLFGAQVNLTYDGTRNLVALSQTWVSANNRFGG